MPRFLFAFTVIFLGIGLYFTPATQAAQANTLVTCSSASTVSWIQEDGSRHVFPNEKTFFSWFPDFNDVKTISCSELSTHPLTERVTYKPGSRLIKIQSDSTVYTVEAGAVLRQITSEADAKARFGDRWADRVDDIPVSFWSDYRIGAPLEPLTNVSLGGANVWAQSGEEKVVRSATPSLNGRDVLNARWDGSTIRLSGAKNEVVSFALMLEAGSQPMRNVSVSFDRLDGPDTIATTGDDLFDWTNRPIELFYTRYLEIEGISRIFYESYDERHIPEGLRRPYDENGRGNGTWEDRPNANEEYPDIAVPIELHPNFTVPANSSQMIWADVYVPKDVSAGSYAGQVTVKRDGASVRTVPVALDVYDFTLPDEPASETMLYVDEGNIAERYTGVRWPDTGTTEGTMARRVRDRHYQMAHRHKIALIDHSGGDDRPSDEAIPRLNGSLFTAANGYAGPGVGSPNDIFSIGTYGTWSWRGEGKEAMQQHAQAWESWFQNNAPDVERFLYLIDESSDYDQIEEWATWVDQAPAPGSDLKTFATVPFYRSIERAPSLDIHATWANIGDPDNHEQALLRFQSANQREAWMYNGKRPSVGTFAIEDDGVALRQLPWAQFKKGIGRWFYWESTYYDNFQGGTGDTDVFQQAHTFGGNGGSDSVLGESGWNYSNGDGVLFYPGTDTVFPSSSYGIEGPIVSLRMKYWRRGIQDVDYLTMAAQKDPAAVQQLVREMVPKVLWEYGVDDPSDPTWVHTDISWSTDPDVWNQAREKLAEIITK